MPSDDGRDLEHAADHPVGDAAVERAGEERPHRDQDHVVAVGWVHQRSRGIRREHERDPRQDHDQEHGLGSLSRFLVAVGPKGDEDRARRGQDEQGPEPPLAQGPDLTS